MEADFVAGLEDPDPEARISSIQRLGGLGLASSRAALHRSIAGGSRVERSWAVYAALRTGDASVLPQVREMAARGDSEAPLYELATELRRLKDRSAIPGLIAIADTAPDPAVRECALVALGENIRAPETVPTVAAHLTDADSRVRYSALVGMEMVTHEPACKLPAGEQGDEETIERQVGECAAWWRRLRRER